MVSLQVAQISFNLKRKKYSRNILSFMIYKGKHILLLLPWKLFRRLRQERLSDGLLLAASDIIAFPNALVFASSFWCLISMSSCLCASLASSSFSLEILFFWVLWTIFSFFFLSLKFSRPAAYSLSQLRFFHAALPRTQEYNPIRKNHGIE